MKEGSNLHATDWCGIVKSNDFIPLLTDLEAPTLIYCQNNYMSVCEPDYWGGRCGCQKMLPCTYICGPPEETRCINIESTSKLSDDEES